MLTSGLAGSIGRDLSDQASNLHILVALVPLVLVTVVLLLSMVSASVAREERAA